jgi:hypothetical protein
MIDLVQPLYAHLYYGVDFTVQDLRTDAISGRGARPCAPTDGGSKVNLRKS